MKALTVNQPWASLFFHPTMPKDVENRTWRTNHRGKVLIHAGKKVIRPEKYPSYLKVIADLFDINTSDPVTGAIIGEVMLVDCVQDYSLSVWAEPDAWHWIVANPVLYSTPITGVRGKLSLWDFEPEE